MANAARRLAAVAVPTASTTIYTVPAATTAVLTEIIIVNTTDVNATVSLSLTPPGVGATALDIINDVSIPANGFFQQGLKQVLPTGEIVSVVGSAAGMNIFVSGVEIT